MIKLWKPLKYNHSIHNIFGILLLNFFCNYIFFYIFILFKNVLNFLFVFSLSQYFNCII